MPISFPPRPAYLRDVPLGFEGVPSGIGEAELGLRFQPLLPRPALAAQQCGQQRQVGDRTGDQRCSR